MDVGQDEKTQHMIDLLPLTSSEPLPQLFVKLSFISRMFALLLFRFQFSLQGLSEGW